MAFSGAGPADDNEPPALVMQPRLMGRDEMRYDPIKGCL